jgi:hypothetical protein
MIKQVVSYKEHRAEIDKAIRNLENLPGGLKCNFLLAIRGQQGTLVAKQWLRRRPRSLASNEVLVTF